MTMKLVIPTGQLILLPESERNTLTYTSLIKTGRGVTCDQFCLYTMELAEINLSHYSYQLPEDRIAQHPLQRRDHSKLLVYKAGTIQHHLFHQLGDHLTEDTTLVFNNTKVIPARIYFHKDTGAVIETLLLNPITPSTDINLAMLAKGSCSWTCMIGNLKRWKADLILTRTLQIEGTEVHLQAQRIGQDQVAFTWDSDTLSFVDLVKHIGEVPLPPYMKRKPDNQDQQRYQTVYSLSNGAVAAPTAGLHFTNSLLKSLEYQGVNKEFITLHVGAGTFLPIKESTVTDHPIHSEQISVSLDNLDSFLKAQQIVAVGTTSLRTLESLYWYGVKLVNDLGTEFKITKLYPYQDHREMPDFKTALRAVQQHMEANGWFSITGETEIFIFPPYQIRSCQGLITNFHLPSSTLILLVAAFIGEDWRKVYQSALQHQYRFLSYGDSSLLLPGNTG